MLLYCAFALHHASIALMLKDCCRQNCARSSLSITCIRLSLLPIEAYIAHRMLIPLGPDTVHRKPHLVKLGLQVGSHLDWEEVVLFIAAVVVLCVCVCLSDHPDGLGQFGSFPRHNHTYAKATCHPGAGPCPSEASGITIQTQPNLGLVQWCSPGCPLHLSLDVSQHSKANLVILPSAYAHDFELFCRRNAQA
jgi:hypothetical protein